MPAPPCCSGFDELSQLQQAQHQRGPSGCTLQFLRLAQEISAAIPHAESSCIGNGKTLNATIFSLSA
jgi:hypothetical protein